MTAAVVRRTGRGSGSRSRRAVLQEPVKRHGTCAVCGGAITFYPRRSDDVAPRTSSIDDSARWAHDTVNDWLGRPHRARPRTGAGEDRPDGPRAVDPSAGGRMCARADVRQERGAR